MALVLALYNGNISSIRWKDNTQSSKRGYKFSYDTANRLTAGIYGEGDALSSNTGRYSESMSYDAKRDHGVGSCDHFTR